MSVPDEPAKPSGRLDAVAPVATLVAGLLVGVRVETLGVLPFAAQVAFYGLALVLAVGTVFVVLAHAEAIAQRIGEPYGTLLLTLAVTSIEASIIVTVMLTGSPNPALARESVFSTVMIVCGGVLGACLTLGGLRHGHQDLKRQGTSALLAMVVALAGLTLVLPNYTLTSATGSYSSLQLVFVSVLCLLLYVSFIVAQMTRHRRDFVDDRPAPARTRAATPAGPLALRFVLLLAGLVGIVLLAEFVANGIEQGLTALQVDQADALIGAFIASLMLMPETVAAIRASLGNDVQKSLNIALGSACASIGLTVPIVAAASLLTGTELTLGLGAGDMVLLGLVLSISTISFGTGTTTVLTGAVHFVIFLAYLILIAVP